MAFLLMGQSNMAGRGDPAEVEVLADGDILMFKDGQWVQATEPLHSTMPGRDAIGLGMSFAAELLQLRPGGCVGLIPGGIERLSARCQGHDTEWANSQIEFEMDCTPILFGFSICVSLG